MLATLGTATSVGLINGVVYVKGRLPHPFIPTLAMLTRGERFGAVPVGQQDDPGRAAVRQRDRFGPDRVDPRRERRSGGSRPPRSSWSLMAAARGRDHSAAGVGTLDLCRRRQPGSGAAQRHPCAGRADLGLHHVRAAGRCRRLAHDGQGQRRFADQSAASPSSTRSRP